MYNELGQVTASERYEDVAITLTSTQCGSAMVWQSQVIGGNLFSDTRMYYDEQGRNIESVDATGLRLGSIFYTNGELEYTGPLTSTAPTGGRITTLADGTSWVGFDLGDFVSYTHYEPNQYDAGLDLFYGRVTDANGHHTDSYKDAQGRAVRTVYDDGSFTETLYSYGNRPVSVDLEGETIGQPDETQVSSLSCAGTTATVFTYASHNFAVGDHVRIVGANQSQYNGVFTNTAVYPDEFNPEYSYSFSYTVPTGTPAYATGTITAETVVDVLSPTTDEGWTGISSGGKEVVSIAQRKTGDTPIVTFNLYDGAGRLTDVWQAAVVDADPASSTYNQTIRPHYSYQYDTAGNEVSQLDPTQQYAYQDWQETYEQWQTAHQQWQFDHQMWEEYGQYMGDPEPMEPTEPVFTDLTRFAYDQNDQQVSRTLPGGERETHTYDQYGNAAGDADFDGNTTSYSYYPNNSIHAGMPHQVTYVGAAGSGKATQTVALTYDSLGRIDTITDLTGVTTYHYDPQGFLTQEDTPQGVIHYIYNNAGQHTQTYTANTNTLYDYDGQNRLWHVTVTKLNGQTLSTPLVTTYGYDPAGNKTSEVLPNGVTTTYTYDDLNRLTDVVQTKGAQTLFTQHYTLRNDSLRSACAETQLQDDGTTVVTINTVWTYDDLGRLTSETVTSSDSSQSYTDSYTFDLVGNRMTLAHTGPGGGGNETVTYIYSNNDQLTAQTSSLSGVTSFAYDANGSQASSVHAGQTTVYTYDVRNKMIGISIDGVPQASYVYDFMENRVSQTAGGVTTVYLIDTANPTGFNQPIEAKVSGMPILTYTTGDRVFAQTDATDETLYLVADGHGSTRELTDANGAVTRTYSYDAYGNATTDITALDTSFLYGGDAIYDPASGMYFHGNGVRTRLDFRFLQMDTYDGSIQDPMSLHKYLYAYSNPIAYSDPSGHFISLLFDAAGEAGELAEGAGAAWFGYSAMSGLKASIALYNGFLGGIANTIFVASGVDPLAAFAIGFAADFTTSFLSLNGVPCPIASGIGGAMLDFGNNYLANGSDAFSWEGLGEAVTAGLISSLFGCFVGDTFVLMGDGTTQIAIDQIQVGQRVATDGGLANSPDGQTAASNPNATQVDPATWRLITIVADDWEIQTLQPLSWIEAYNAAPDHSILLSTIMDVAEMGVPEGLYGTIESIADCPTIDGGPGRVVLTTMSHLNSDVYTLTLTDSQGQTDNLGVTGGHKIYTEDRGWVEASELVMGEVVRGANGDVVVTSIIRDPGTFRVYNMTVEADHDYYVGDLSALVHNACGNDPKFKSSQANRETLKQVTEVLRRLGKGGDFKARDLLHDEITGMKYTFQEVMEIAKGMFGK